MTREQWTTKAEALLKPHFSERARLEAESLYREYVIEGDNPEITPEQAVKDDMYLVSDGEIGERYNKGV